MNSFYQWLQVQVDREDVVGDFAYTVGQFEEPKPSRKKISGHMMWASWLVDKRATADLIDAFNVAWSEYQQELAMITA